MELRNTEFVPGPALYVLFMCRSFFASVYLNAVCFIEFQVALTL